MKSYYKVAIFIFSFSFILFAVNVEKAEGCSWYRPDKCATDAVSSVWDTATGVVDGVVNVISDELGLGGYSGSGSSQGSTTQTSGGGYTATQGYLQEVPYNLGSQRPGLVMQGSGGSAVVDSRGYWTRVPDMTMWTFDMGGTDLVFKTYAIADYWGGIPSLGSGKFGNTHINVNEDIRKGSRTAPITTGSHGDYGRWNICNRKEIKIFEDGWSVHVEAAVNGWAQSKGYPSARSVKVEVLTWMNLNDGNCEGDGAMGSIHTPAGYEDGALEAALQASLDDHAARMEGFTDRALQSMATQTVTNAYRQCLGTDPTEEELEERVEEILSGRSSVVVQREICNLPIPDSLRADYGTVLELDAQCSVTGNIAQDPLRFKFELDVESEAGSYSVRWVGDSNRISGFNRTQESQVVILPNRVDRYIINAEVTDNRGNVVMAECPVIAVENDLIVIMDRLDLLRGRGSEYATVINRSATQQTQPTTGLISPDVVEQLMELIDLLIALGILDSNLQFNPNAVVPTQTATPPAQTTTPAVTTQAPTPTSNPTVFTGFNRDLTVGSQGEDVRRLQQFLNRSGYFVAATGAGSLGNETIYFGPATQSALARYQAANNITPAEGYFGLQTRNHISGIIYLD